MTLDHLTVIVTGLLYVGAGMVLGVVARLLGPTYHTKVTAAWWVIITAAVAAVGLIWRGATILFPGEMVDVARMSLIAPVTALIVVGMALFILDFVMGDRSPPPLFERYLSMAIRRRVPEEQTIQLAFDLPPAMHHAAPAEAQISRCGRKTRLAVLTFAAGVILILLGVVASSASGG